MERKKMTKIFIIGSERSGTNLLQKLMSNHQNLIGPKTPHLINTFFRQERYFGDLSDKKNQNKFYKALLLICNHEFSNWNLEYPKNQDLISRYKFIEAILNLYIQITNDNQKSGFIAKELNSHLFINEILELYPDSKFIHIVRNPLEQASSWMKTPLFYYTPQDVAKDWVDVQQDILNKKSRLKDSVITCKYEDLVSNTELSMTKILNFCNLEIDENCFQNKTNRKGDDWNELWKNVNSEVQNDLNKHKDELTNHEIEKVQNITIDIAFELGYFKLRKYENSRFDFFKRQIRIIKSKKRKRKTRGIETTTKRIQLASEIKKNLKNDYLNV
jgi:hypothetical protein